MLMLSGTLSLALLAGSAAGNADTSAVSPAGTPTGVTPCACPLGMLASQPGDVEGRPYVLPDRRLTVHNAHVLCFPANLPQRDIDRILDANGALPPTQFEAVGDARFFTDTVVWQGDGGQGPSGQAIGAHLTYSFPDDGTTWGLSEISATGPNNLNQRLIEWQGAADLDLGREYFRQSLANWRKFSGNTYTEVGDDNAPMDQNVNRVPTRGDIRIGGLDFGTGSFLAYNAFPTDNFASVGGGDMCFNNSFWLPGNYLDPDDDFRYLRNTVVHEHGHGLGYIHSTPCDETKVMEPFISVSGDTLRVDGRRGLGRNYGDRFTPNHALEEAADFGSITDPPRSVLQRDLSTNGEDGPGNTSEDWFRFEVTSNISVTVSVTPTGGTYANGQQLFGCFGSQTNIQATSVGNLEVSLRNADGSVIEAEAAGPGSVSDVNEFLTPGTYYIRVKDIGPTDDNDQTVQLYDLLLQTSSGLGFITPDPLAIAGVNKRIEAGERCWFIGDINSEPSSPADPIAQYRWDTTGDGEFDVVNAAKTFTTYVSNGVYPVTLEVRDLGGRSDTDTIFVEVFGATTTLDGPSGQEAPQGVLTPIVITGTNLKNVESAAEFGVSGSGVELIGTPVPNAMGTQVTGLSVLVDAGAPLGARTLTVSNADGSANLGNAIVVIEGAADCPGDFDGSGDIDLQDLNTVLANFGGPGDQTSGDADGNGVVNLADLNTVLALFGTDCP